MKEEGTPYNQFDLNIEVLSPLHIGNGETLTSVGEFITTSHNIRYLKLDELNDLLDEKELTDDYTDKIIKAAGSFDTFKTLMEYDIDVEGLIQNEIKLNSNDLNPLNNNILHIFHNSEGKKYIPGSSVKGMLKTVLLFHYLNNDRSYLLHVEKIIKEKFDTWNRKNAFNWLKKQWDDVVKDENLFYNNEFNLLRPADSMFIKNDCLLVEQVKRQHFYGVDSDSLDWLQETVKKGTVVKFKLRIIPEFSDPFTLLNSEDSAQLFEAINEYSLKMIDFELDLVAQSFYVNKKILIDFLYQLKEQILGSNNQFAICRLGKGKSIYFQTILSLLDKDLLNILIKKLYKSEGDESDYFPNTRVLTAFDEMLGWIKIKEADEFVNNTVDEIKDKITTIKVNFISQKSVTFRLNDVLYENIQLINPLKKNFKKYQVIDAIIWQTGSKGINQIKIE